MSTLLTHLIGSVARRTPRRTAEVVPFPRSRRLIVDVGQATRARPTISGLILADVTSARQRMRDHQGINRRELSLTAYIAACVGRAVATDRQVHAVRDLRGRLVRFDDVDINVLVEVQLEGRSFPMNHVVRAADKRSVADISDELHRIKRHPSESPTLRLAGVMRVFLALPAALRRRAIRLLYRLPDRQKALAGTVGLTAVGMFARGGGWGTGLQVHPLEVVVGGIAMMPALVAGDVTSREHIHLTLSFDHDIVDGAPAARFSSHLRELIEAPDGLIADPG